MAEHVEVPTVMLAMLMGASLIYVFFDVVETRHRRTMNRIRRDADDRRRRAGNRLAEYAETLVTVMEDDNDPSDLGCFPEEVRDALTEWRATTPADPQGEAKA